MDIKSIELTFPELTAKAVGNEFGTIIVLTGKGSKVVANHLAKENYLNGFVDTQWRDVRHGFGYAIPLYNNPIGAMV